MDRRTRESLEQERDRAICTTNKMIEKLDVSYTHTIREKDALLQKAFQIFEGEAIDFQRLANKIEMNTAEFEKLLRKKRRFLEESKKEVNREFERKTRR